jgi:antitoxin VapB
MTNTLPADPETEQLAERIAALSGKSVPRVVKEAIAAKAEAMGIATAKGAARSPQDLRRLLQDLAERFDTLPGRDTRPADEIIGYDELGLPR